MSIPLPEVPQTHYDEQRSKYGAETSISTPETKTCSHGHLKRLDNHRVECIDCRCGWIFQTIPEGLVK